MIYTQTKHTHKPLYIVVFCVCVFIVLYEFIVCFMCKHNYLMVLHFIFCMRCANCHDLAFFIQKNR